MDFISGKVVQEETPTSQLTAYIEACLAYQVANFKYNIALIEIVFNVENEEGIPFYRADNGEEDEDPIYTLLKEILLDGQQKKEFSNQFDVEMICVLIQGAIEESMLKHNKTFSFEKYKNELIKMVLKIVI